MISEDNSMTRCIHRYTIFSLHCNNAPSTSVMLRFRTISRLAQAFRTNQFLVCLLLWTEQNPTSSECSAISLKLTFKLLNTPMNKITTCELAMATCIKEERYVAMISCGM